MATNEPPEPIARFEVSGLDRAAAEAFALEVRRLAGRHGIDIRELTFERATGAEPDDSS